MVGDQELRLWLIFGTKLRISDRDVTDKVGPAIPGSCFDPIKTRPLKTRGSLSAVRLALIPISPTHRTDLPPVFNGLVVAVVKGGARGEGAADPLRGTSLLLDKHNDFGHDRIS